MSYIFMCHFVYNCNFILSFKIYIIIPRNIIFRFKFVHKKEQYVSAYILCSMIKNMNKTSSPHVANKGGGI